MSNILIRYIFTFLLSLVIIFLSVFPFGPMEAGLDVPFADKWVHFAMYGAMSFTLLFDFSKNHNSGKVKTNHIIISLMLSASLGGIMELIQGYFLIYRSGDWIDVLANCLGAAMGVISGFFCIPTLVNIYNKSFFSK